MSEFDIENQDFTARDFQAMDGRLKDLQSSIFENIHDPDLVAVLNYLRSRAGFTGSMNDYYLAQLKREAFVPTMRERRSAVLHGKRQGYNLSGASAATVDCVVTVQNGPLDGTILLQAGDKIKTAEIPTAVVGEIQSDVLIGAGELTATVSWKHSVTRQVTFTSTGKKNQTFMLPDTPYLDGSVTGETSAGEWTAVDDFLDSRAEDRHFTVFVDQNDQAFVKTGDDKNGAIPRGQITFTYKTGGGESGNVDPNSLTKMVKQYKDSLGTSVVLTVSNPSKADGGENRETVNAAKANIPNERRLPKGTVATEDFEIRASGVEGVGRVLFLSADRDSAIPVNEGRIFIVPPNGGTPSQSVLDAVVEEVTVTYPTMPTFVVKAVSAEYLTIDIYAVIYLSRGSSATVVKASVLSSLTTWFQPLNSDLTANMNVDFGYNYKDVNDNPAGTVDWSEVHKVVNSVVGVRKIGSGIDQFTLNGKHSDVTIGNWQFPILGDVILINGDTGSEM